MRVLSLILLACLVTSAGSAPGQKSPQFGDFPARVIRADRRVQPRVRSTPYTPCFRTMLRDTVRRGKQFAGHYMLSYWGCGTECARLGIVDLRTGRAYVSPFLVHAFGIEVRPDSRLLIVNAPERVAEEFGSDPVPDHYRPQYYLWDGRRLLLIDDGKVGHEPPPSFRKCAEM